MEIIKALHSDRNINSLIFTLTQRAHELCDATKTTLFWVDKAHEQLVVGHGELNIRIPINKGIAGYVATEGKAVNIPDAYDDERFNKEVRILVV